MKRVLAILAAGLLVLLLLGMANADSVCLTATGRGGFYVPSYSGWDNPYFYLSDNSDEYIKFDLGNLANNPNVYVDSAFVTVKPDAIGNWNGIWDSVAGLYRATVLDFSRPGSYDNSVMYSQDAVHASADSVFDATELVRGWTSGYWNGDVVGGVALHYINPAPNANLMYLSPNMSGATLTINYHMVDSLTVNCTGRNSVYCYFYTGWNTIAYLNDNQNQYIKFDIGSLANNPQIAIDSAAVRILNGSHVVGNWNNIWDSTAGMYRAIVLDFMGAPDYDDTVMYSQAGMHQTADSVFDATELVRGWAANTWPDDVVGGVMLKYLNESGNASLMYSTTDYTGAVLSVQYHSTATGTLAATPTFSPGGGTYTSAFKNIVITCATPGATIRYTTDGSVPSETNGTAITSGTAVLVDRSMTLSAKAWADGYLPSNLKIAAYTLPSYNRPRVIQYSDNVTVDGNLGDWADAQWAPIDQTYDGDKDTVNSDIPEAYYAAKWGANGNKVYVAVKVRDKFHHFTDTYTSYDARDAVEIYLHTTGTGTDYRTNAQQYAIGMKTGGVGIWTNLYGTSEISPDAAGFKAAAALDGNEWIYYEAEMTPFEYFGAAVGQSNIVSQLTAGEVIGLDVIVAGHNDTIYTGMKSENTMDSKYALFSRFGQHLLVKSAALGDLKNAAENAVITGSGIVTAVFDDCFYIESADRTSGVRINQANSGLAVGQMVNVSGTVQTLASGERCVVADYFIPLGMADAVKPLGMVNKVVGGGQAGLQGGVEGGTGLNNLGLLVRTTGTASAGDNNGFTLTDGSGVNLYVSLPGAGSTYDGKYVTVTGISSIGSGGVRVIKARSTNDVDPVVH